MFSIIAYSRAIKHFEMKVTKPNINSNTNSNLNLNSNRKSIYKLRDRLACRRVYDQDLNFDLGIEFEVRKYYI